MQLSRGEARRIQQKRVGQIADGRYLGPRADRVTLADLASAFLDDYRINGRKILKDAAIRVNLHLVPFFGKRERAQPVTATGVRSYASERQEQGAGN